MLSWPEHRLDHPDLDAQHAVLFGILLQLDAAAEERAPAAFVGDLVAGLKVFAQFHLRCEEILMEGAGYPALAEHCGQHVQLMDAIEDMQGHAFANDLNKAKAARDFIAGWLTDHIRNRDGDFVRFLRSGTAGA